MGRRVIAVVSETDRTRVFEQVWETLALDAEDQDAALDATIVPDRVLRQSAADEVELPTLELGEDGEATNELTVTGSLGQGGMGIVQLATQHSLLRDVAVKRLIPGKERGNARLKLFQEAWMTGLLEHPNIVPIHQLGKDAAGNPVLVMKLIEGVSWRAILKGAAEPPAHSHEHADPQDLHLEILIDVCNALEFAHSRGIVHRDLKPDNVMIGAFGEVYLLDWGVAVSLDGGDERLPLASKIESIAGTPTYMAPEMTDTSLAPITPATDVYLLGAVLHEILTGHPPHRGDSLFTVLYEAFESASPQFEDDVPDELVEICQRAMSRDPADRYDGVRPFRKAVATYLRHRASYLASQEASERLAELERELEDPDTEREWVVALFSECRFGFEQAIRSYQGNVGAHEGLQTALERMVDYEIDQGAPEAAEFLVGQMPQPEKLSPERRERLDSLLANQRQQGEQLRQLQHDMDLDVGAKTRTHYVLALGVFWGILSLATGISMRLGYMDLTAAEMVLPNVLFGCSLGIAAYFGRRSLLQNAANRRLVLSFLLIFVGTTVAGIAAVWLEQTHAEIVVIHVLVMFLIMSMIAIAIDHRLAVVAVIYLAATLVSARHADHVWEVAGVADLIAMGLLALLWWPREGGPFCDAHPPFPRPPKGWGPGTGPYRRGPSRPRGPRR